MYEPLTKLKDAITDHDTNQGELAQKIDVTPRQIYRWIKGEQEMGIWKLKAICEELEISADYLLGLPKDLNWPR